MTNFNFIDITYALMKEWVKKYDADVHKAFLKTIEAKQEEILLFQEVFIHNHSLEVAYKAINAHFDESKSVIELEIAFRYLLLDWSKYVSDDE